MKNSKGFSIVELIVAFSLTSVILVMLFEIVISAKEIYEKSVIKTELLNRQNLFTDYIYTDLNDLNLSVISLCGNNCIRLEFVDGEAKELTWNIQNGNLRYENYAVNLLNNTNFDEDLSLTLGSYKLNGVKICYNTLTESAGVNSYVNIDLPIYSPLLGDEDFGLKIFYTFNGDSVSLSLPKSSNC